MGVNFIVFFRYAYYRYTYDSIQYPFYPDDLETETAKKRVIKQREKWREVLDFVVV
jgi:hypothetical protein